MEFSKMSTFQVVVLAILGVAAFAGLAMFSLFRSSSQQVTTVVLWGILPATQINTLLQSAEVAVALEEQKVAITYVQKAQESMDQELLKAMALDQGPDAIILAQNEILNYLDRTIAIPYETLPQRTFQDTYIPEGQLFLNPTGVVALPFMINPMVMYWNQDMLTSENIATPPQYWPDLLKIIPRITKADVSKVINRSTIGFGTYDNIDHAKDIISLLLLQAGTPITAIDVPTQDYRVNLSNIPGTTQNPGDRALSFYTQFADSTRDTYSWNASLPYSRDYFVAGKLGLYFGFASENPLLREQNPNLNYDVALVPQTDSLQTKVTFGKMYGLAILRGTLDVNSTFTALSILSNPTTQATLSSITGLPPVTRALYATTPADPDQVVFYTAALQSRGWLEPNADTTNQIFSNMVRSINSGAVRPIEAVRGAEVQLNEALPHN